MMDFLAPIQGLIAQAQAVDAAIRTALGPNTLWTEVYLLARLLAVAFAVVLPFELFWARNASQKILREGFATDLAHMFFTKIIGNYLVLVVGASFIFALMEHYLPLNGLRAAVRSQPVWLQAIQLILLSDFVGYWTHRWMHEVPLLWRAHACHHSSPQMDILATVRVHPLQLLFAQVVGRILPFSLGFSVESLALAFSVFGLWGFFEHANVRLPPDGIVYRVLKPLRWIFVTPRFHHWHHDYVIHDCNYGITFSFWDRLFGTAHFPEDLSFPERYGIPEQHPRTWVAQMVYPFLSRGWQKKLAAHEARLLGRKPERTRAEAVERP